MFFSPLAMREDLGGARPSHARRLRRAAAGSGHAGRDQPAAALPACLPRGSAAASGSPDRRAAPGASAPSSKPRPTARASPRRPASRTSTRRSSARSTSRSMAGELTGAAVDCDRHDRDRGRRRARRPARGRAQLGGSPAAARAVSTVREEREPVKEFRRAPSPSPTARWLVSIPLARPRVLILNSRITRPSARGRTRSTSSLTHSIDSRNVPHQRLTPPGPDRCRVRLRSQQSSPSRTPRRRARAPARSCLSRAG